MYQQTGVVAPVAEAYIEIEFDPNRTGTGSLKLDEPPPPPPPALMISLEWTEMLNTGSV